MTKVQVYVPKSTSEVGAMYETGSEAPGSPVIELLRSRASKLLDALMNGNDAPHVVLSNWHPRMVGLGPEEILGTHPTAEDALLAVVREHGFSDIEEAEREGTGILDPEFEMAVDQTVNGEVDDLSDAIDRQPDLGNRTSAYGHRATLLRYVAANGVETVRQRVPSNAVDIVNLLVGRGADVNARARMYGGWHTPLPLLTSSAHPKPVGLMGALVDVLAKHGANQE